MIRWQALSSRAWASERMELTVVAIFFLLQSLIDCNPWESRNEH